MNNIKIQKKWYYAVDKDGGAYLFDEYPFWNKSEKEWFTQKQFPEGQYINIAENENFISKPFSVDCNIEILFGENIKDKNAWYYTVDENGDGRIHRNFPFFKENMGKKYWKSLGPHINIEEKKEFTPEPIPVICKVEILENKPSKNIQCEGDVNGKKDVIMRCINSYPDASNTEIAKRLKEAYPDFFANVLTESVRKQVGKLRSTLTERKEDETN